MAKAFFYEILPLEAILTGQKMIGPEFWAEQLTKHFNSIED